MASQQRVKGGKAAAAKAQARAARQAAEQAASAPEPDRGGGLRGWLTARDSDDLPPARPWLVWLTWALTLAGLGVSIYLTIVELRPASLFCPDTGIINCGNVLHSSEGKIFGIAVAYYGLAFFAAMVVLNSPWAWRRRETAVRRLRLVSFIIGMLLVLYLVYAELIEIGNICLYCTSVHVITFLLFVLIVFDATFRTAPPSVAPAAPARPRR
jgi:uncharacterized membrane protein